MKNLLQQKHSYSFLFMNLYLFLFIVLPKDWSTLFGFIPIRLALTYMLLFIVLIEGMTKRITCNHNKIRPILYLYIIFLLTTIPSLFLTYSKITTLYTILKFISFIGVLWTFTKIKFTKEEIKQFVKTILFSSFIVMTYGIIEYIFDLGLFKVGIHQYPGAKGRATSVFFNPIYFGIFINLIFIYCFYFFAKTDGKKRPWQLLFFTSMTILCYFCLLFTYTRSALLLFVAILGFTFLFYWRFFLKPKCLILFITLITLNLLIPGARSLFVISVKDAMHMFGNFEVLEKFLPHVEKPGNTGSPSEKPEFTDDSLQHRQEFSKIANRVALDHIWTGVGFGTYILYMESEDFAIRYPDYKLSKTHPHSAFVLLFAEAGISAVIVMGLFLFSLLYRSFAFLKIDWKEKGLPYQLAVLTLAISLSFIGVNIFAENAIYDTQIFPIFLAIIGLSWNAIQELLGDPEKKVKRTKILFISSTGGHLNEMMQLKSLFQKYDSYLITEKTKSNLSLMDKYPNRVSYLIYGTKDKNIFLYLFKLCANCFLSLYYYIKIRPTTIITTGTHTAGPICCIGKLFGSKIIYIETFANRTSKTATGRLLYLFADCFIVQWESMLEYYPKAILGGFIY